MRYLILVFLAAVLWAPAAHSAIVPIPSDNTAGGGTGDIPFFIAFGGSLNTWPDTDQCLRAQAGGNYRDCASGDTADELHVRPYLEQAFVRYLICTPARGHSLWLSGSLSVAVYEVQGSSTDADFVRNKISGDLTIDEADPVGVGVLLTINAFTTLSNGQLQVKFSAVSAAPVSPANGLACTLAGFE